MRFAFRFSGKCYVFSELNEKSFALASDIKSKNKKAAIVFTDVFEDNELCGLYLNFSDPWPKTRHHKRRLTYIAFLEKYKKVIKPEGKIFFKTDNRPLFDFSLVQFMESSIPLSEVCTDLHTSMWENGNIHTEYEDNFSAKGFTINRLVGTITK